MARKNTRNTYARRNQTNPPSSLAGVWLLIGIFLGVGIMGMAYIFYNPTHSQYFKTTADPLAIQAQEDRHRHKTLPRTSHRTSEDTNKAPEPRFEFYTMLPGMEVTSSTQARETKKAASGSSKTTLPAQQATKASYKTEATLSSASTTSSSSTSTNNDLSAHSKVSATQASSQKENPSLSQENNLATSKNNRIEHPKITQSSSDTKSKPISHYIVQAGIFQALTEADALKARLTLQGFSPQIQKVQTQDGHAWFRVTLGPFTSETLALNQKKRLENQKVRGILILQRPTE